MPGGDTRVYFGWVCAAQVSKFGPRPFQKEFEFKMKPVLEINLIPRSRNVVNFNSPFLKSLVLTTPLGGTYPYRYFGGVPTHPPGIQVRAMGGVYGTPGKTILW